MRICFLVSEIFAFRRLGGYGKLVRMLGSNLAKRGVEVYAVTWRDPGQRPMENVDGITVLSFPYNYKNGNTLSHLISYLKARPLYRLIDADVYHSAEASVETYLAEREVPHKKHIIHFQDPYDQEAFIQMSRVDKSYQWTTWKRLEFLANRCILRDACSRADRVYTQAKSFIPKVRKLYNISKEIRFLPNPVCIPHKRIAKASRPTVCFLGRWDPQKRVEIFLKLARKFSHVDFVAMGKGHDEEPDEYLRKKYENVRNLKMPGFVSEEEKSRILMRSWLMINTSIREGLPIAFLEALAHKTAILSSVNPDSLASTFGLHVNDDEFELGLKALLRGDIWKEKGEAGYRYVCGVHEINKVTDQCLDIYRSLLET